MYPIRNRARTTWGIVLVLIILTVYISINKESRIRSAFHHSGQELVTPTPCTSITPGFSMKNRLVLKDLIQTLRNAKNGHGIKKEDSWTYVLYNLTMDSSSLDYPCVRMHVPPQAMICLYPEDRDQVMSRTFYVNGTWEWALLNEIKSWLSPTTDIGFIDIGANIGAYTLPVAAMGHPVLAVEPNIESVRRLHKAIALGNLSERVTVLANAVSNQRLPTKLLRPADNQAGVKSEITMKDATYNFDTSDFAKSIYLNDLLPFCNFSIAIMKIDIVGFEHRALRRADLLFDNMYIPYVQMEWYEVKKVGLTDENEEEFDLFMYMLHFFRSRQYVPRIPIEGTKLNMSDWANWPLDVVWTKSYL